MRIRNVKPEITKHEDLADLPRDHRLFFIYLWMLADVEGRLEDRPRRIKADLFPYDEDLTPDVIDGMLNDLAAKGFVQRYEVDGLRVIWIPSLAKHQTFSTWERKTASELPPPPPSSPTPAPTTADRTSSAAPSEDYGSPTEALPPDVGRRTKDVGHGTKDEGDAVAQAAGAAAPPAPFGPDWLIERWKASTGGRLELNAQRRKAAEKALKRRPDPEFWARVLAKVAAIRALPDGQWAKLDWLLASKKGAWNYDRIAEGEFDFKLEQARPGAPIPLRRPVGGLAPAPEPPPPPPPKPGEERPQRCGDCGALVLGTWDGERWRLKDHFADLNETEPCFTPGVNDPSAEGARSYA